MIVAHKMSVQKPNRLLTLDDYEKRAKELLDPGHYEYIAGGVGDNVSLNNNRKCFDSLFLIPKVSELILAFFVSLDS